MSMSDGGAAQNLALIVGCARSGTSILGELAASHPEVTYVFEAHAAWALAGLGENESHRLTEKHAAAGAAGRIRDWFDAERASRLWLVEKNPRNTLRIPFLRAVFPQAKIVHIVRDGRDAACSLVPGIGGDRWSHLKPPSWKKLLAEHSGVVRCALAWQEVVEIALADLVSVPHLTVRYEDLVTQPKSVARRLLGYLGLPEDAAVFEFCRRISNSTESSYQARHQLKWSRNDHHSRVGRWREWARESPRDMEQVQRLLQGTLTRLGYV
jgi:sulfotransferase family protein